MKKLFCCAMTALSGGLLLSAATLVVNPEDPKAFRTIGEAAAKVEPGDVVLVHRGVYREHVALEKGGKEGAPVVFRAAHPGEVFVKGSDLWKPELTPAGIPGCFTAPLPAASGEFPNPFLRRINAGSRDKGEPTRPAESELLPYSLGQIFCNGLELRQSQTAEEVRRVPGSWIVSADGLSILLHLPAGTEAAQAVLEVTLRDRVFAPARRGLEYVHIEGFVFEHCANQAPFPQLGMVSVRSGRYWVIKDNVIRFAKTVGLDIGSEYWMPNLLTRTTEDDRKLLRQGGRHLITGNRVVDNGLCGIAGWNCTDSVVRGNIVERNNNLSLSTHECNWEEWGGIKLHEASGVQVEDNLVRFNGAHGIWLDNGYNGARISRNVVFGNIGMGIFIELGAGQVIIDNNIVSNTSAYSGYYPGYGIYAHDASGVKIYHNLVMSNAADGVFMRTVTDRKYQGKLVETSDEEVLNNIFYRNNGGVTFPYPTENSRNCLSDRNLFIGPVEFRYSSNVKWDDVYKKAAANLSSEEAERIRLTHRFTPQVWPKMSGWESSSLFLTEGEFEIRIKPFEPSLYYLIRSGKKLTFKPVAGLERDFNGSPYGEEAFPGPFQNPGKPNQYRILFPL